MRTPAVAYHLITRPSLRRRLGGDDPERDISTWIPAGARRVAEIGAGGGYYTTALARHLGPGANLTAIDPDPRAVAALTRRGLPAVRADGADLPFADDSLDTLFYSYSLEEFPDPAAGIAEAARVLRPGGGLVLFLWRANLRGCRRALRTPALGREFLQLRQTANLQNIRHAYALVGYP